MVDKDGYVVFVNEMSNDAFTSFRYDDVSKKWGMLPVVEFEDLPSSIKGAFYKIACGGEYTICEEAYLYTNGIEDDTNPQDVVYLFELCKGIEDAIKEEASDDDDGDLATTTKPTKKPTRAPTTAAPAGRTDEPRTEEPTTGPGFVVTTTTSKPTMGATFVVGPSTNYNGTTFEEEKLVLTYRAVVSDTITSLNLNNMAYVYRSQLLGAMSTWTMMTASEVNNGAVGRKRVSEQERNGWGRSRGLLVYSQPSIEETGGASLMDVFDVNCGEEQEAVVMQQTDHCIEVKTRVTLVFVNEPPNSNRSNTLVYFEDKFEISIDTGDFRNLIVPNSTKEQFRVLYSASHAGNGTMSATAFIPGDLIAEADENKEGEKKLNTIAIAAASCIVLVVFGVLSIFIYHRRRSFGNWSDKGDDSTSGRDARESCATPDFNASHDLEGGEKKRGDVVVGSDASSGDSESDSSSMESYSDNSSDDSSSTSTSDVSANGNQSSGSLKYQSNVSEVASASEVYAGRRSRSPRDEPDEARTSSSSRSSRSSAKDRSRNSSTPTDEESSAGSSGWESSNGSSSVDSDSVESYRGDLGSSKSGTTIPSDSSSQESELVVYAPAKSYVRERGVTMIPIDEEMRSKSSSSSSARSDVTPAASAIEEAIELGDWQAVGSTAKILAMTKSMVEDDDASKSSSGSDTKENDYSSTIDSSVKSESAATVDSDVARAAEIDQLVESGNWHGVVAVAARYVEEAEEADEQLQRPLRGRSSHSPSSTVEAAESDVYSVSVETADPSSSYSTMRSSRSNFSTLDDSDHGKTVSGSNSSSSGAKTISTHSSSSHERRKLHAYRAEVEALVRRVVPDELSNVDDILVQFTGREKELIETLRAMQEKSIAQRARAAVQRSAKKERGRIGKSSSNISSDSSSSGGELNGPSIKNPSGRSDSLANDNGNITNEFTKDDEMSEGGTTNSWSTGVSDSREGSGRSTRSGATGSSHSGSSFTSQTNATSEGSSNHPYVVDASDWRDVSKSINKSQQSQPSRTSGDKTIGDSGNWSGIIQAASNMTRNPGRRSFSGEDID